MDIKADNLLSILFLISIGMVLGIVVVAYFRGHSIRKNAILREFWKKLRDDSHYTSEKKKIFLTLANT